MSCNQERPVRAGVFMKLRVLLLSILKSAAICLPAAAQDDKSNQKPTASQTQPAPDQTQAQPADDPGKTAPAGASQDADDSTNKSPKAKHDGSKKDVDSIGNRKVGGLDWY